MSADDKGDGYDGSFMGSKPPILNQNPDDDASWPSICSHHGSRYPRQERFVARNEQGAIVLGYTKRTLNAQDIPWVMVWLQGDPERMVVGTSLCLLNGVIFPIHDIPEAFRAILEREQMNPYLNGKGLGEFFCCQSCVESETNWASVYSHAYHEA